MTQDKIKFQEFKQISFTDWEYEIVSALGSKYRLQYKVLKTGFIRETMISNGILLFDREFRAGERLLFTAEEVIAHFGNVNQAIQALVS